ncbi:MAG: ribosomal protection-like ABC-F family protein [Candidatus Limnocylindrales bacterium]
MSILRLSSIRREVGTFTILDDVTASLALGDRVGLVGPNGAGKTTLLRIAAGLDEPDAGDVQRKREASLGFLLQESHFDAVFMAAPDLRTAVRAGATALERMEGELRALEEAHRVTEPAYERLQHEFEVHGGYTLDQRVDEALSGLGFERAEWARPPAAMSGGQQTRAALARLVIADPDILLLDEPTNHLDIAALEWTEEHLRRRSGSLIVASHDRAFLDATVTRIWELRDRRLAVFRGDYSAYHRQRVERDERAAKDASSHAAAIVREQELVQRYRSHRKFSKMHEHEARLDRLQGEQVEAPRGRKRLRLPTNTLSGHGPARSGETVVTLDELVVGYRPDRDGTATGGSGVTGEAGATGEPKQVARIPWLTASRGERIGIVGPNGAGKTTLLRTVAGDLAPLDGRLAFGGAVQIGYLTQLRDAAIPGTTVLDALLAAMPVTAGEARSYLARFLFRGDDAFKEVRLLSGGERSRLELAMLGITPANLLLLDEPTNHLDIPAREAIEAFLAETPATVVVVSHDRRLLETICDRLWVVDDGLAVPFDGGYRAWRAAVSDGWSPDAAAETEARRLHGRSSRGAAGDRDGRGTSVAVASAPAAASAPTASAARRPPRSKLSKDQYRRQKAAIDADLTRLGLRKNHLELAMTDPTVNANFVELRRITSELADVEVALGAAEEAWLELEERAP